MKRAPNHVLRTFALAGALLCALGCEPGPLIHNSAVDLWCGDRPCHWDVQGRIERIGTWHERDYAVEFVSDDAQLSQWNQYANAEDAGCYDFAMVAKLDPGVKLYLELDFLDDGVIDWSRPIPESDWQRRTFLITAPTWYQGVRFILRKDGPGYAALAQLSGEVSYDCTRKPIDLGNRPGGAPCEHDEQCALGACNGGLCDACTQDRECDPGLCGVGTLRGDLARFCVAEASTAFGERCSDDAQCQSGVCCDGVCSSCCEDGASCVDGQTCGPPVDHPDRDLYGVQPYLPRQCAAGEGRAALGDVCIDSRDCASGRCTPVTALCAGECAHDGCQICELTLIGGVCE